MSGFLLLFGLALPYSAALPAVTVNTDIVNANTATPQFSIPRGLYNAPFSLTLTTTTPGAIIRYTLDYNTPDSNTGLLYEQPIYITHTAAVRAVAYMPDGSLSPSPVVAHTYLFVDDVPFQAGIPPGYPNVWGGYPADYDMDPEIVNDPVYHSIITDALRSLPVLSVVMDVNDLFGSSNGIYTHPMLDGELWERPASAELIYPDGTSGFQINAGIRIFGGASREPRKSPKHAFRLLFKGIYGPTKLNYDLFGNDAVNSFDTLVLRAGYNSTWIHGNIYADDERSRSLYVRDQWANNAQRAMGQMSVHGTYVHLYLNGLYWGIYNLHERPDASFMAAYYGGDKEEYDVLNSSEPVDGNRDAWNTMMALAGKNLTGDANYQALLAYLDIDNLIDYLILNQYGGNQDWDEHNWYAGRRRVDGAVFRFFVWDSERTLEDVNDNILNVYHVDKPSFIFQQLRANEEFRMLFADHVYRHLFHDGALTPTAASARFQALTDQVYEGVVAESARWGDYRRDIHSWLYGPYELYTRDDQWITERDRLLYTYFPQRTAVLLQQYRSANLYPLIDPPQFNQEGGDIAAGFILTITNPISTAGEIYYTLDGYDPRLPYGGGPSATAVTGGDLTALTLTHTIQVKARVYDSSSGEWSALHETVFRVPTALAGDLLLTELMYNPPEGDAYEFIELKNSGSITLDLGLVAFTNGITYTFAPGTSLIPDDFIVLAKDPVLFQTKYGFAPFNASGYEGQLSNGGETIALSDALGDAITAVTYDDQSPWPASPDGYGFTLVPVDPNSNPDPNNPLNWRASAHVGGSPNADDPFPTTPPIRINELLANSDAPALDQIELYNPISSTVDLSYWYLTDDFANPTRYQIPNGTVISGNGYLVFDENKLGFAFSSLGEAAYLFSDDLAYSHGFTFGPSLPGVSFGRYTISTGDVHYPPQSTTTFGAANAYPKVGPVVISSIMYHPDAFSDEFLVLTNITSQTIPLYDTAVPTNTWQISGIGDFSLPPNTTIPPYSYIVIVGINPTTFRTMYNVPAAIQVIGPYTGGLSNGGELITLQVPGASADGPPYIVIDAVNYDDTAPWPIEPDGSGPALQRINNMAYGDDPINWQADANWDTWPLPTPTADLSIHKRVMPETAVLPGQRITYTLTYTNSGPMTATHVILTDTFPLLVGDVTTSYHGAALVPQPGVQFVWQVADLPPNTGGIITLTGVISSQLNAVTVLTNVAAITSSATDPIPGNNQSSINTTVRPPQVAFNHAFYSVTEAAETAVLMITLSPPPLITTTVQITTADGTATAPDDYIPATGIVTIPAGYISQTIAISIAQDMVAEPPETLMIMLIGTTGAVPGAPITATLTISDDDIAQIMVMPSALSVSEGGSTANYTVTLTSQPTDIVTITLNEEGNQLIIEPEYMTFTPFTWDMPQTLTVTAVNDNIAEGLHTATVAHTSISSDPFYHGFPIDDVLVTISDNDTAGIQVMPSALSVSEGGVTAVYAVSLSSQPTDTVTILGTANEQVMLSSVSSTFTPLTWNIPQLITVTAVDDIFIEEVMTTTITLNSSSSDPTYQNLPPIGITVTITDNDLPVVNLSQESYDIMEAAEMAVFTVTLHAPAPFTATVAYETTADTALAGADYTAVSGTLIFAPGQTMLTVTIPLIDDDQVEPAEVFLLHLSQPTNATLGNRATVVIQITDDDNFMLYLPLLMGG